MAYDRLFLGAFGICLAPLREPQLDKESFAQRREDEQKAQRGQVRYRPDALCLPERRVRLDLDQTCPR